MWYVVVNCTKRIFHYQSSAVTVQFPALQGREFSLAIEQNHLLGTITTPPLASSRTASQWAGDRNVRAIHQHRPSFIVAERVPAEADKWWKSIQSVLIEMFGCLKDISWEWGKLLPKYRRRTAPVVDGVWNGVVHFGKWTHHFLKRVVSPTTPQYLFC